MTWTNQLYFGDNLSVLREHIPDESVDLIYLDPPFNSIATYNVFKERSGEASAAQITAFDDPLYLKLDHNISRSDGGFNHISDHHLLCGPCSRIKSNRLPLSGLRAENQRRGRMAKSGPSQ